MKKIKDMGRKKGGRRRNQKCDSVNMCEERRSARNRAKIVNKVIEALVGLTNMSGIVGEKVNFTSQR